MFFIPCDNLNLRLISLVCQFHTILQSKLRKLPRNDHNSRNVAYQLDLVFLSGELCARQIEFAH